MIWLLTVGSTRMAAAQVVDLAAFQDSVKRIDSIEQLRGMLSRRSNRSAEKSPVALSERGFIALRLYDLTYQTRDSKLAQESFKQAIKRDPEYGWAHYGLGLAYVNGPDAHPERLGWRAAFILDDVIENILGDDFRSRAHRAFLKAVDGRPPVTRAAEELAENAVAKNRRKTLEDAHAVLEQHVGTTTDDGESWVALARVNRELGYVPEALTAMERALEKGAASPEAHITYASLLLRTPGRESDGATVWLAGIENLSGELADQYFGDIQMLLSKSEHEAWKKMDLRARAEFLREFWPFRAGLAGVSVADRLAEHYRRLSFARQRYFRESKYGAPESNALRLLPHSQRSDFDDRGLIYIRHGEPRTRLGRMGLPAYESWVYPGLDDRDRAFHFFEEKRTWGFSLMHKIPCDPQWLADRVSIDARFHALQGRCREIDRLSVSADIREIAFEALESDSDAPDFMKELPFFFDLYTFRGLAGRTDVVAAVAVPADKLNRQDANGYRIDVSLILADTASKHVIRQDDSVSYKGSPQLKHDDLVRVHVEIAVPPSRSTVQRVIVSDASEPGVGQLYGGPFTVPDYTGSKLMLSDVVLAEPGVAGRWHRGSVALALVPTGHFKGGSFNIFYEIYNIAENAAYSTEIEIEPIRRSPGEKIKGLFAGKNTMRLQFSGVATGTVNGTLQELRRVDAPLGGGRYRLNITVRNADNQEIAKAERVFEIPD